MPTKNNLVLLSSVALLSACASPSPLGTTSKSTSVKFPAILLSGCLMPAPENFIAATKENARLSIGVATDGSASSVKIEQSTGSNLLDQKLIAAARLCRFSPAYSVNKIDRTKTDVVDDYVLNVVWKHRDRSSLEYRCFPPSYPHAARRANEQGEVIVRYRRNALNGSFETMIEPESAPGQNIRATSLQAVEACLSHPEFKAGYPEGQWRRAIYSWRIID